MSLARHVSEKKEHSAMRKSRIDEILMKIKIGKEAASFALKAQQKELNYDDQSENRRKESEVFQNVPEGSRSKLEAIRESFRRQDEQREEFMKIWQQVNPVKPKISLDKHAEYKDKFDYMANKPKAVDAQARELGDRLSTVNEDGHKKDMGIAESVEGRKTSREGQAAQCLGSTSVVWKSKTQEVLAVLRRQEEERRLEIEQFEIECMKKREKWDAEWRRMFDSCLGQESVNEKPRVTSATVSRSEARVNGIVVSSTAVVQDHLDGGGETASMSAKPIHCKEPGDCKESDKRVSGNGSMEERTVLSEPGQKEVATSSECSTGAVRSAAVLGARSQGGWSASWSSSEEISRSDVSGGSGMTAVDCTLGNSLSEETDGDVFHQVEEINQNDVVCVDEETCDDSAGVPEGCQDVVEMEVECRDASRECCRCEGIYELNEELMRERCGGILEDSCERGRLEEGVVEELIFFSDGEDETDEVCGSALDDSWIKDSDSRVVFPAGVIGGSESADDRDCNGEGGIVFYPGEDPTWTSETCVVHGHIGLKDVGGTVLAVGDAYGEELACGMEQCGGSIDGLSGGSLDVESVDPPWASAVGEITFVSQVLTFGVTRCTE